MRVQEIENHTPQDHLREIQHKFPQVNLHVSCQDHGCVIDQLMVDPQSRNQGWGKQIMQHLVDWADQHNKILALTPSKQWASSIKRLMAFYKQWNFVPNQGKHKDFRFRETLIREPQTNSLYKILKEAWTLEDQQMVHKNPSIQDLKNLARHNKYHSARFVIYKDGSVVAADSEHYTHHSAAPAMGAWMVRGYVQWMGGKDYLYRSMEVYSPKNMDHPVLRKWEQGGIGNGNPEIVEGAPIRAILHTDPDFYGASVESPQKIQEPVVMIPANKIKVFEPDSKFDDPQHATNLNNIKRALKKGQKIPPILVRRIGTHFQVLDGHHRFRAYRDLKIKQIPSRIIKPQNIKVMNEFSVDESWSAKKAGIA